MATTTTITTANSRLTFTAGNEALNEDGDHPGPETLIVNSGAYMIATGAGTDAVQLDTDGAWTVIVNGSIFGTATGLTLETGNTGLLSSITIGAEGQIGGTVGVALGSNATIKNAGTIIGTTVGIGPFGGGTTTIVNSGTVTGGTNSIVDISGAGNEKVTNSGRLNGDVSLGGGNDTLANSGIIDGDVFLGAGTNKFANSGTLFGGVLGGSDADTFTNFITTVLGTKAGTLTGAFDLGAGDDKFFGGSKGETVVDGAGADSYNLGGGNDLYLATGGGPSDGIDKVDGSAGIDTYDASFAVSGLNINLDTIAHTVNGAPTTTANTANGADIAGALGKDTITGFENAVGGAGQDNIYGTASANVLMGNAGVDRLLGFGGNDTLFGGNDLDVLIGGAGRDTLTGGAGLDYFQFQSTKDSGVTAATRDVITDFQDGLDQIDIALIDADTTIAGDQAFDYRNGASTLGGVMFGPFAGGLRSYWTANGYIFEGEVNGDGKADFSFEVLDPTHTIVFTITDFLDTIV